MESQKRLSIAMVLLGETSYSAAIFCGYAALSRLLPARQAA